MAQKATLKDVAREAGLSLGAASKALNGYPNISEATRERVKKVSQRLGYPARPKYASDESATPLREPRAGLVLLEEEPKAHYAQHWIAEFVRAAKKSGIRFELGNIGHQEPCDLLHLSQGVEGLLLFGCISHDVIRHASDLGVPLVVVGNVERPEQLPVHHVHVDTIGMGRRATRTLLEAGHEQIGFFCPTLRPGGWFDNWLAGYQMEMLRSARGLEPTHCHIATETNLYDIGGQAARYMLALDHPPTAYVIPEVRMAMAFRNAMAEQGVDLTPRQLVLGGDPDEAADHRLGDFPLLSDDSATAASMAVALLTNLMQQGSETPARIIAPYCSYNLRPLVDA